MLALSHTTRCVSIKAMRRLGPSTFSTPILHTPTRRTLHTSYRLGEQRISPASSGGGSSSSGRGKSSSNPGAPSMVNILVTTATIVIATPFGLDLYGSLSGTAPSRPSASSIPGKLEPYTHHSLPLAISSYYPDPNTASAHKLLQIALPCAASPAGGAASGEEELKRRLRIRSIYVKEPSLVIERAYTPLYDTLPGSNSAALVGTSKEERQVLDLIVKRYSDGELGRMLHRAMPNPTIPQLEIRGPVDTWSFERDSSSGGLPDRIVMVVGGTGVTPAYQLLTNLFGRPDTPKPKASGMPKLNVLYAAPDLENALLLSQLHALAEANQDKVKVSLFAERLPSPSSLSPADSAALGQLTVSSSCQTSGGSWIPFFGKTGSKLDAKLELSSPTRSSASTKIPVFESRITQQHLEKALSLQAVDAGKRTIVLVCGPDGMVDALTGPKSRDGRTQGQLSGILARIGLRQEDVFKL